MFFCLCRLVAVELPGRNALLLKWEQPLFFGLDDDRHALAGIFLLQRDDVLVEQSDAALAGASGHCALVVGAAVDADAAMPGSLEPEEPVAVGQDAAPSVAKVVFPRRGILDHGDGERLAVGRFRRAHIALALFVSLVLAHAHGIACQGYGVVAAAGVDGKAEVLLGDDDKRAVFVIVSSLADFHLRCNGFAGRWSGGLLILVIILVVNLVAAA